MSSLSNGNSDQNGVNDSADGGWKPLDANYGSRAIHSGYDAEVDAGWGEAVPPIMMSAIYLQKDAEKIQGYHYTREGNPTRTALGKTLAALENGKYGFVFPAGVSAITGVVLSFLKSGDDVIAFEDLFIGTNQIFRKFEKKFGITVTNADWREGCTSLADLLKPNTKLVWIETPTNPTLKIVDIARTVRLVKEYSKDILVAVDNTFLTSYFQKPLDLGADLSMMSMSKYANGHSDVLMGSVVANREDLANTLEASQYYFGMVPSPFDCYLALRGLKTLHVRMTLHMENGLKVARFLENHPRVEKVLHPGLPSHPERALAQQQASGHSGLICFYIKDGKARDFLRHLKVFQRMFSLGGPESLACAPSLQTHAELDPALKKKFSISDNMVRLSVGLESAEDLTRDLDQALNAL